MSEFVHHHIIYTRKIGSPKTAAIVRKNLDKGSGQCCTPTYSKKMAIAYGGGAILPFAMLLGLGFPLGFLFIFMIIGLLGMMGYHLNQVKLAKPHMVEGSDTIICLGSDDSNVSSSAPWADSPGLSKPWGEFAKACRRYERLLTKMPEKDLIADQMFYGTVADIYALFEHTHHTSESLSKHQMQLEFQTIQQAIEKFKLFVDRSSEIYASLRFNQTDQVMDLIENNLNHMNETALTKIEGLRELENPRRKDTIALDGGDAQKKGKKSISAQAMNVGMEIQSG